MAAGGGVRTRVCNRGDRKEGLLSSPQMGKMAK